jgi:hypothetical protein
MSRLQFLADLSKQPLVRLLLLLWAASGIWDLALSEWIPEEYSKKLPRVYQALAMTTGLLPWQIWIVAGAMIFALACLEYVYRRAAAPQTLPRTASHPMVQFNYAIALSADGNTIIDPAYVVSAAKGRTERQLELLLAPIVGKSLTISGVVDHSSDIRYDDGRWELWVYIICGDTVRAEARFAAEASVSAIVKGAPIVATGKFAKLDSKAILITDCEVIQIAPL